MLLVYPLSILSICLLDCINMSKAKHQSLLGYLITKKHQDWTSGFEFHNALIIVTTFYNDDVFGNAYLWVTNHYKETDNDNFIVVDDDDKS